MPEFWKWREVEHDFVNLNSKQDKSKYFQIKRELLKLYPKIGKALETFEIKMGT